MTRRAGFSDRIGPLLRPTAADRFAIWLITPLAALAALALLIGQGAATFHQAGESDASAIWTVAVPAGATLGAGDQRESNGHAIDEVGLAAALTTLQGVQAARPVAPEQVASLTADVLSGLGPDLRQGGVEPRPPLLIDLTVLPMAAGEQVALADRIRGAVPVALIIRPSDAGPGGAPPSSPLFLVQSQDWPWAASAAVVALAAVGLVMTVVTRHSLSDNWNDVALLHRLGAESRLLLAIHGRRAIRVGWWGGVIGTIAALIGVGSYGAAVGITPEAFVQRALMDPWLGAAALAVPLVTMLICRITVGTRCAVALRRLDRLEGSPMRKQDE